jgi:hypothetical protein
MNFYLWWIPTLLTFVTVTTLILRYIDRRVGVWMLRRMLLRWYAQHKEGSNV